MIDDFSLNVKRRPYHDHICAIVCCALILTILAAFSKSQCAFFNIYLSQKVALTETRRVWIVPLCAVVRPS